jgi:hypothetical protein
MTKFEPDESQQQPYDRALKSLMEDHAAEMVPELVPETRLIAEQNNELTRLNLRADIVYLVEYRGEPHILDMELQTEAEKDMALRMLIYHLELFVKFRLPVLSVVLYPSCGGQKHCPSKTSRWWRTECIHLIAYWKVIQRFNR